MNYLQAISGHIKKKLVTGKTLTLADNFDSWMENAELVMAPKDMGLGYVICHMQYTAVIYIERLTFKTLDPAIIFANVVGWLDDHDNNRAQFELADPQIAIDDVESQTADITIDIQFIEEISLVEDKDGPVDWQGKTWKVLPYVINTAQKTEVIPNVDTDNG